MKDYSQYNVNNRIYTGSEEKFGITIDDEHFIVKFQKNSETGLLNNHISEHFGSSIFSFLGEEAQTTSLGTYNGRPIVLCKDFNTDQEVFTPFNGVGESSLERDKEMYSYSYDDITSMLKENSKITNVSETIEKFWNMYIIDALIGNFDRHGANWGFIKKNNTYRMAPIFDNGSSLFPRRNSDELMIEAMNNEETIKNMTFKYPTSQIKLQNKKSSYCDVISSLEFNDCNYALERIYKKIDLKKIYKFIDLQEELTSLQKSFYKFIIEYRFTHIIEKPYKKLIGE
ncbi:MAG: HipA domain-containing protein [Bacillota bacterium]